GEEVRGAGDVAQRVTGQFHRRTVGDFGELALGEGLAVEKNGFHVAVLWIQSSGRHGIVRVPVGAASAASFCADADPKEKLAAEAACMLLPVGVEGPKPHLARAW